MIERITRIIGVAAATALMFIIIAGILGLPVMWMWNYVIPPLFGLPEMNFWQALWGLLLARMLFTDGSLAITSKNE